MGAKKKKCFLFFFSSVYFSWPPLLSVGGHNKQTQTYRAVHAFRSTVQNLPLRTRCAQGEHHFHIDVPKVGLIFKLMCPTWAPFSNFKLARQKEKRKYRNNCFGNEHFFVLHFFCILVVP